MSEPEKVRVIRYRPDPVNEGRYIPEEILVDAAEASELLARGRDVIGNLYQEPTAENTSAALDADYQRRQDIEVGGISPIEIAGRGIASGATFGLSEMIGRKIRDDEFSEEAFQRAREENPITSIASEIAGSLNPLSLPAAGLRLVGRGAAIAGGAARRAQINALRARAGRPAWEGGIVPSPENIALFRAGGGGPVGAAFRQTERGIQIAGQSGLAAAELFGSTVLDRRDQDAFFDNLALVAGLGGIGGALGSITSRQPISNISRQVNRNADDALREIMRTADTTASVSIASRVMDNLGIVRGRRAILSGDELASEGALRGAQRFNAARNLSGMSSPVRRIANAVGEAFDALSTTEQRLARSLQQMGRGASARAVPTHAAASIRSQLADIASGLGDEASASMLTRAARRSVDGQLDASLRFREKLEKLVDSASTSPAMKTKAEMALVQVDELLSNRSLGSFADEFAENSRLIKEAREETMKLREVFGQNKDIQKAIDAIADGKFQGEYQRVFADLMSSQGQSRIFGSAERQFQNVWDDILDLERAGEWAKERAKFAGSGPDLTTAGGVIGAVSNAVGGGVGLLSHGLHGLKGALAGHAISQGKKLLNPYARVELLSKIRDMLGSRTGRINSSIDTIKNNLFGSGIPGGYRALASTAASAHLSPLVMTYLDGSESEKLSMYENIVEDVERLTSNHQALINHLAAANDGIQDIGEDVAAQLAMRQARQLQALNALIPPSRRAASATYNGKPLPPTSAELDAFLEAAAVFDDPVFGMEMLAAGVLSNSAARMMEHGFPGFFRSMSSALVQNYMEGINNGEEPNYQAVSQLSTLLGFPLDPSLQPMSILGLQENWAQTSQQEMAIRSPETRTRQISNHMASMYETKASRLENA